MGIKAEADRLKNLEAELAENKRVDEEMSAKDPFYKEIAQIQLKLVELIGTQFEDRQTDDPQICSLQAMSHLAGALKEIRRGETHKQCVLSCVQRTAENLFQMKDRLEREAIDEAAKSQPFLQQLIGKLGKII